MQRKIISTLALLMLLGCGCSRQETQKTLASRLSEADRVIVLNPNDGVTMTLTGDQLKKLVKAIEASQKVPGGHRDTSTAVPGYTLVFFRSTVHLATVATGADVVFYVDGTAYEDKSRTIRAAWEKFWEKHPASLLGAL